jgi:hypothetical protein
MSARSLATAVEIVHGLVVAALLTGWLAVGVPHRLYLALLLATLSAQLCFGGCPLTRLQDGIVADTARGKLFVSRLGSRLLAGIGVGTPLDLDRWLGPISLMYLFTQLAIGLWVEWTQS